LRQVIAIYPRKAERSGKQSGRLRREIESGGVRRAQDRGQSIEEIGAQTEFIENRVERAGFSAMALERALDVERRGGELFGDRGDLGRATNRNTSVGSSKRRISHRHAIRSTFGRVQVTQAVRPCSSRAGRTTAFKGPRPRSKSVARPPAR
jgi:hypothetical protein